MCEWCGHNHSADKFCEKRPRWDRRGFISLFGAGLVGLALPNAPRQQRVEVVRLKINGTVVDYVASGHNDVLGVLRRDKVIFKFNWLDNVSV